jgi:hypothetical protein
MMTLVSRLTARPAAAPTAPPNTTPPKPLPKVASAALSDVRPACRTFAWSMYCALSGSSTTR